MENVYGTGFRFYLVLDQRKQSVVSHITNVLFRVIYRKYMISWISTSNSTDKLDRRSHLFMPGWPIIASRTKWFSSARRIVSFPVQNTNTLTFRSCSHIAHGACTALQFVKHLDVSPEVRHHRWWQDPPRLGLCLSRTLLGGEPSL